MSPPLVTRQVSNLLVVHFISRLSLETKPRPKSWPTLSIVWRRLKKVKKARANLSSLESSSRSLAHSASTSFSRCTAGRASSATVRPRRNFARPPPWIHSSTIGTAASVGLWIIAWTLVIDTKSPGYTHIHQQTHWPVRWPLSCLPGSVYNPPNVYTEALQHCWSYLYFRLTQVNKSLSRNLMLVIGTSSTALALSLLLTGNPGKSYKFTTVY